MIDKIPAIGRFLFRESFLRDGFFQRAGTITRISGKRIYYQDHHESAVPSEKYLNANSITAVCDTAEEIAALTEFNRRALDEIGNLKVAHKLQAAAFFQSKK